MDPHLDDQIRALKERIHARHKLEAMLADARDVYDAQQERRFQRWKRLEQESGDYDQLRDDNLVALFYSVLGTKESRLEKERQEYLAARLKHEEAVAAAGQAQQEVERLESELRALGNAEAEYEQLLAQKQSLLAERSDPRLGQLVQLAEQLADLAAQQRELEEAIAAGKPALRALEAVAHELSLAELWSSRDQWTSGGYLNDVHKHSRIDAAKAEALAAQRHLQRFHEELADARHRLQLSLKIDGFARFSDDFFDGLISDWIDHSKITHAAAACSRAIGEVQTVLNQCSQRHAEVERKLSEVTAERRELIEEA